MQAPMPPAQFAKAVRDIVNDGLRGQPQDRRAEVLGALVASMAALRRDR